MQDLFEKAAKYAEDKVIGMAAELGEDLYLPNSFIYTSDKYYEAYINFYDTYIEENEHTSTTT